MTGLREMGDMPAPTKASTGASRECGVCRSPALKPFIRVDGKDYWGCRACRAVLLDPACLPTGREELDHYLKHENDPRDIRYRRFLARLAEPMLARLAPGSSGLDYGCGPGPALATIMREAGHAVRLYDPFFAPDAEALEGRYDFILCSEVAEHFHRPAEEFERLDAMLEPGGWLGLMTCFRTEDSRFATWHYRRDPTHVVFYREETLRRLAARFDWACEIPRKDVALFRKPPGRVRVAA